MVLIWKVFDLVISFGSGEKDYNSDVCSTSFSLSPRFFGRSGFARRPFLGRFHPFFIIQKGIGVKEGIDRFIY